MTLEQDPADTSIPLCRDLDALEKEILSAAWHSVPVRAGIAAGGDWPTGWDLSNEVYRATPGLIESRYEIALEGLPKVPSPMAYDRGYGLIWMRDSNTVPRPDSLVGLTPAGLARLAEWDEYASRVFDELINSIADMAHTLVTTNPIPGERKPLAAYFERLLTRTREFPSPLTVQSIGQLLQREYGSPFSLLEDRGDWTVDIGNSRIRRFDNVRDRDTYWRTLSSMVEEHQTKLASEPQWSPLPPLVTQYNFSGDQYNVSGSSNQIAARSSGVVQQQGVADTAQYDQLRALLQEISGRLGELSLDPDDQQMVVEELNAVLAQTALPSADPATIRRAVTLIKGALASLAVGVQTGVAAGIGDLVREWFDKLGQLHL